MKNVDISEKLNGLDLFSGIGGISYALQDFINPIAYCEIEPYCQSVLLQRMQEGDLPKAPIWDDVKTLPYEQLPNVDIIYGGFPCQGVSIAGAGKGLEDERSGLFFEILRLCSEIKPRFLFLENVPAITSRDGIQVVREIAALGYDCRWCIISASGVGALHRRERWFLLANSKSEGLNRFGRTSVRIEKEQPMSTMCGQNDSYTDIEPSKQADKQTVSISGKREAWGDNARIYRPFKSRDDWQEVVGGLGRCVDGVQAKMDFNTHRLRALGNAVVPQQVRKAWEILTGLNK